MKNTNDSAPALRCEALLGDFNVRNSTKCHLDGQVFARRVDAAIYMSQKLGFKLADAARYVRELPERDSSLFRRADSRIPRALYS